MHTIETEKLTDTIGVEILATDVERLLTDDDIPAALLDLLEEHSVLLFRELHIDDDAQVEFCRRLGTLASFPRYRNQHIMEISFEPGNPNREYFASNDYWHIDGALDPVPAKASILSARVTAEAGGETEFASTYAAYDALSDEEKDYFSRLRVVHTFEAIQRLTYPDPTPEQLAEWASRAVRELPLVWEHESGRRSMVFGATASHIVGMEIDEGRALLRDLEARATRSDLVYRHAWTEGDMVIWDNTGLVHRACPFDRTAPRRMHRSTLVGTEAIV